MIDLLIVALVVVAPFCPWAAVLGVAALSLPHVPALIAGLIPRRR